jgi:hypothetical protein
LILLALAVGMGLYAVTAHWWLGYYIATLMVLVCWLIWGFVSARFRPSNWLVRMNEAGLFIQFRSYLNYRLPAEDMTVLFVAYPEIRSARLVKERTQVPSPGSQSATSTQTLWYAELELAGDIAPLERALRTERREQAPNEKHWYVTTSTLYQDYSARMPSPPFLQIRWQAVPSVHKFLDTLGPYTTIADPVFITQDFAHLQGLSRDEQLKRLHELAERGQKIAAIYTARRLYGCELSEAKQMVEAPK